MLARYADRAQNRGAAAVPGFLAIQYDQLLFGRRAAHLLLDGQNGFLHLKGVASSSLRPSVWRNSRAACSANGKQTCSPVTGAVTILRLSLRLLLISCTRALVGGAHYQC